MIEKNATPASAGIAIGHVFRYQPEVSPVFEEVLTQDPTAALADWDAAKEQATHDLQDLIDRLPPEQAAIFEAHMDFLLDDEIDGMVRDFIREENAEPGWACKKAFSVFRDILSQASDPLISARTADLDDVCQRLIDILHHTCRQSLADLTEPVILAAHDLLPSDTASMKREYVLGIATECGGTTSHSAIIARSFGIPAVLGVEKLLDTVCSGEMLILDGSEGLLIVGPTEQQLSAYEEKRRKYLSRKETEAQFREKEAALSDGTRIQLGLNIGSAELPENVGRYDFVGLFRTEFLYMNSDHMPTEEEQFAAYRKVLCDAAGPVTLRTLDIGGDKTLPYFTLPKEDNPFLGERALRLCLRHPDLFRTQLRAALRASVYGKLQIMFPMVGSLDDIHNAKGMVYQVMKELDAQSVPYDSHIKLGVMIEIPSIAEMADRVAQEVDFASIGTNDLCQYFFAVDRMNPALTDYYQSFSPAFLHLLKRIIDSFAQAGKELSMCGELAGDARAAAVLAGMGLKKFSVSASNVNGVKFALHQYTADQARDIADQALHFSLQSEVLNLVTR